MLEKRMIMQSIDNIKPLNWTVLCHLAGLIGLFFPLGNIILPIIIWLKKSEQYPEVYKHGVAVINFQISWTIYMIISGESYISKYREWGYSARGKTKSSRYG